MRNMKSHEIYTFLRFKNEILMESQREVLQSVFLTRSHEIKGIIFEISL